MQELETIQRLGDDALIERLTRSVRGDRQLTVRMLIEMGEVQARELFRDLGLPTMFEYATRKLGMSEAEAALRIRVAKLGRQLPLALEMLGLCEVNLTTLSMLVPMLTADNLEILYEARFKSKPEVLELIARILQAHRQRKRIQSCLRTGREQNTRPAEPFRYRKPARPSPHPNPSF